MSTKGDAPPPYATGNQAAYPPPYDPQAAQPAQYSYPPGQGPAWGQPGQYGQPQQHHSQTTVVVGQPSVAVVQTFRESPVRTRCPTCGADIMTSTYYTVGTLTWIICLVVCCLGCYLGCCLIPFCIDGCKDVVHSCPNCRTQIARWSRM